MITLRITRTDEDTGAEIECGEIRMQEIGAPVFSHRSTADGHGVVAGVVGRLNAPGAHEYSMRFVLMLAPKRRCDA